MDYLTNKELSEDIQLLSKFGKLLSHSARINIITMIAQSGNKLPIDKIKELGYSDTALEKHLDELMNIGLVYSRKNEHSSQIYCLDLEVYSQFKELFEKFFNTSWGQIQNKNTNVIQTPNGNSEKNITSQTDKFTEKDLLSFIKST